MLQIHGLQALELPQLRLLRQRPLQEGKRLDLPLELLKRVDLIVVSGTDLQA